MERKRGLLHCTDGSWYLPPQSWEGSASLPLLLAWCLLPPQDFSPLPSSWFLSCLHLRSG